MACCLMLLAMLAAPPAETAVRLELAAEATVSGETIRLGDLCALPDDSPLRAVGLAPAPLPGAQRTLRRGQIASSLGRAGYRPPAIELAGAETIIVRRVTQTLAPEAVARALVELLGETVTIDRLPPLRPLPAGAVSFRLRGEPARPLIARCTVGLDILVDGRQADTVSLTVMPELPEPEPEPTPVAAPTPAPTPEPAPPIAAPAAPPTPARPTWQVKRGDKLTVTVGVGRVAVSFQAEAKSSGGLGDTVQVEARIGEDKRTYAVRLTAPDRAVLEV